MINSFGFFIKFLEEENEDITKLLNQESNEKKKHLCLYDFKEIKNGRKIHSLLVVHFMSRSLMDKIIHKNNDIYDNYGFENVNIPAFVINEAINNVHVLIEKIKEIYVNYFGSYAKKNNEFKIYFIKGDINNLDILKIEYIELTSVSFIINYDTSLNNNGIDKYKITRLLVGI